MSKIPAAPLENFPPHPLNSRILEFRPPPQFRNSGHILFLLLPEIQNSGHLRYVVDASDWDSIPVAKTELHELLMKPSLNRIPLLVLGNKIDKSQALTKQALVDQLGLDAIKDREVSCYMISCKESINIDMVIDWLIKHSKSAT